MPFDSFERTKVENKPQLQSQVGGPNRCPEKYRSMGIEGCRVVCGKETHAGVFAAAGFDLRVALQVVFQAV